MSGWALKRNGDARTSSAKLRAQSSRAYTIRIPLAPPGFEHARRVAHCCSRNEIRGGLASSTLAQRSNAAVPGPAPSTPTRSYPNASVSYDAARRLSDDTAPASSARVMASKRACASL